MKLHLKIQHGPSADCPTRRLGLALGLTAAAVTALCAAYAGVDSATVLWRASVSFASVWAFQWSMLEVWKIAGDEPVPVPAQRR